MRILLDSVLFYFLFFVIFFFFFFFFFLQRNSIMEIFKKCNLNTSTLFSISKHLVLLAGTVPI